jgi:Domain of unknown function (DUF4126)
VHLVFDIFQGIGIAAAVGIRPYLPALAVGGLAAAHAQIKFSGTDYVFLQRPAFLGAVALAGVLGLIAHRVVAKGSWQRVYDGLAAVALGALFFAGSLCRGGAVIWPGFPAGVVCAAIGIAATVPLLARVRARLDDDAASTLPLLAEGAALVVAVLSVLAPPVGPIALAVLLWLVYAGRRRDGQKYAGLRILR